MLRRLLVLIIAVAAISLLTATAALAATPEQIYEDFSTNNGVLSNTYSNADLTAFLNYAPFLAYPPTNYDTYSDTVRSMLSQERRSFPFTGFQLMIAGIIAVVLVGGGIALRRFARPS